ncbi:MAG: hypothetical protein LAO08_19260 [Acidobacteriia bacterium]|nr:hypothetical protein [Terriglobia bacterium]
MARKDIARSNVLEVHRTIPVLVRGYSESGEPFNECTYTVTVSNNGCLIELKKPVRNEQLLVLRNVETDAEILCYVATRANSENGLAQVKLGFISPSQWFWELTFPAKDRNPTSDERLKPKIGDFSQ